MTAPKERADKLLVRSGLAESRHKAQALIMAGRVMQNGEKIEKPGQLLNEEASLSIKETLPFVGRGGLKLEEALDSFRLSVKGQVAADLGASTGGFSDCLLQRGARKVYAVDVETRQLDWNLSKDSRLIIIKKNARALKPEDFDEKPQMVVMDLSFISLLKVLPAVKTLLSGDCVLALIKPQFEAGRGRIGKKGVIRDKSVQEDILGQVIRGAADMGFHLNGILKSSTRGQKGNREFFAWWSLSMENKGTSSEEAMIKEAVWNE